MAPISNASRLADFGTGIGTQGAAITVDNTNERLGVGTDDPQSTFQVGVGCSISKSGVVTASSYYGDGTTLSGIETGVSINAAGGALQRVVLSNTTAGVANTMANTGSLYWNDNTSTLYATNVNISGTTTTEDTQNVDSTGIVTSGLGVRVTKGGLVVTAGVSTFTTYPAIDSNEEIQVGTAIQLGKAGVITATSFSGSGANLTDVVSGISLQQAGSWVSTGTAATTFNFASGATISNVDSGGGYPGIATITISSGINTIAFTTSNVTYDLDLSNYQDHKATVSGVTTFSCTGGTEGDSHTLRIVNSGVTTVGFSTYFLWPSGSMPSLPSTDGALSLISFTVHREGAVGVGTQLFAGASVDFS